MPTTRYIVEWTPWDKVKAAAAALGWTDKDSAADFVEINDYRANRSFHAFAKAVTFARSVARADTWGCPLIHRQELVTHDTDDMGETIPPMLSWDTDASWECAADDQPDEAHPSYYDMVA